MKKLIITIIAVISAITMTATAAGETYISDTAWESCVKYGEEYNISPELIQAIIEMESSGDRYTENGDCKGLMQVSPKWHADRMEELGVTDIYDTDGNIHVAADYLAELFEEYEDACLVLDFYNGNSRAEYNYKNGIMSEYATKVLERSAELERLHGK